ncbi:MAG: FKBP-type peptidyl-prolyl cis-trans isomerase [Cyclobacteriaceae bacterium]|nr:FKBP-type peptidyl-prolyl cis-trans isomerase [Cyclobacteriaceae bacterium]
MKNSITLVLLLVAISFSCKKDQEVPALPFNEQLAIDLQIIDTYIEENNIKDVLKDCKTGDVNTPPNCNGDVRFQQHEEGNDSALYINLLDIPFLASYKGRLLDTGVEFDANDSATFTLRRVVVGWEVVLLDSKEGDSLTLYIPSGYGYGPAGSGGNIPSNANLIFDIKILQVN